MSVLVMAIRAARRGAVETRESAEDAGADLALCWDFWRESDDAEILRCLIGWERQRVRQVFEAAVGR